MVKEFISQLPPDKLSPFAKHPYQVREDAAMDELVESVRTYGILSPLLARPKGEGYELVSGHRRRLAAQKLGLPQVTYVEEILKCADGKMTVKRHIDGGVETVEAPLPLVLTVNGSAAPCRPRNAKLVMKYKRAMVPMEKPAEGLAYAEEYEKKPYLTLGQLSTADVDADLKQCGLSGSPTKVKAVQNIVFKAKESKVLTASDADIEGLIQELLANHTIG